MTDQLRASHILLMHAESQGSPAERSKEEAHGIAEDLKQQISGGADFAELALAHSECPSASQGGDLGTFGRGMMVPEFETASFALEVGGVSDIVETAFGYHLILRTD